VGAGGSGEDGTEQGEVRGKHGEAVEEEEEQEQEQARGKHGEAVEEEQEQEQEQARGKHGEAIEGRLFLKTLETYAAIHTRSRRALRWCALGALFLCIYCLFLCSWCLDFFLDFPPCSSGSLSVPRAFLLPPRLTLPHLSLRSLSLHPNPSLRPSVPPSLPPSHLLHRHRRGS